MAPHKSDHEPKSPRTFSSASFTPSAIIMTMSTSEQHSPPPLLPSFEQGNSPGIPGNPRPLLLPYSPVDPLNLLTKVSSFIYPCRRPINSVLATTFHYLPLGTPAAPFVPSEHYLNVTPNRQRTRFSQHPAAPLTRNGSQTNLRRLSSNLASTPQHTPVILSAEGQPTLLSQQASLGRRLKEWVGGSRMQWTDIFPNQQHRPNSFPPTGAFTSQWHPRVRRAPLDSLLTLVFDRADPHNLRTPGLAFQRGCLAADTALRAFGPVLG